MGKKNKKSSKAKRVPVGGNSNSNVAAEEQQQVRLTPQSSHLLFTNSYRQHILYIECGISHCTVAAGY